MSIKVVDLQNEEVKEEAPTLEPIEEAKEEEQPELINEVVEEPKEEVKEQLKEEVKEETKPKRQTQKDRISCPKCFKEMSVKSYKYTHQQNCQGQLSEKPVKKHTNPRPKQTPKPKPVKPPPQVYYSDEEEEVATQTPLSKPVRNQILKPQPLNPQTALSQHYQLLQQQLMKQKQEKMNSLCQNMFSSKTKKKYI